MPRFTNDIYPSRCHRVFNIGNHSRYAVPFFFEPNPDAIVQPEPHFISNERPSRYIPITFERHLQVLITVTVTLTFSLSN
jgi:isopenicillin N synthase-like dioxygenase